MRINRLMPIAAVGLLLLGSAGIAFASEEGGSEKGASEKGNGAADLAALANAKVSLSQAITAAEQSGAGKAVSADLDTEKGTTRILVELASAQGMKQVAVDPQTGQVTPVQADQEND